MLRAKLQNLPPLDKTGLWPAQATAIRNLEQSLAENRPRALIQMATGSGKTYTAVSSIYRLVKFGSAQRVLFLVDRAHLGDQALKEFQQYQSPDDRRKFTELYNVRLLRSNWVDPAARVVITTVQRLYSILQGDEDLPSEAEEGSMFDSAIVGRRMQPIEVAYNPRFTIEMFDVIFVDECHRSIYNVWRQVLEYSTHGPRAALASTPLLAGSRLRAFPRQWDGTPSGAPRRLRRSLPTGSTQAMRRRSASTTGGARTGLALRPHRGAGSAARRSGAGSGRHGDVRSGPTADGLEQADSGSHQR